MIELGTRSFAGKRVLLLQGPVGPFFSRLGKDLRNAGAKVFKVNFNAGDWFYYPSNALSFRGTPEEWPAWFEDLIRQLRIDVVLLFGDCRPIHAAAHTIASRHGVEIGVFEEGYLRPDYITFERFGVNGYSQMPRNPAHFSQEYSPPPKTVPMGNTYWALVACTMWYYIMATLGKAWFPHYRHHRPLTLHETFPWVLSALRKLWYGWAEKGLQEKLTTQWKNRYFLVPLQVFNDSQISDHARFDSVEEFIETTLRSFAEHAANDSTTVLVYKHHPMDRGYKDYSALIKKVAFQADIESRVLYIHDQHLPSLLDHARGVVVINSTVGISALHHGTPTKVCGHALYDIEGLTYQGPLDSFWDEALDAKPQANLYRNFRAHVINLTQLNGSFYKALNVPGAFAGLIWNHRTALESSAAVNAYLGSNVQSIAAYKQKLAALAMAAQTPTSIDMAAEAIKRAPLVGTGAVKRS
jgi:capsular polysaccharide export protein